LRNKDKKRLAEYLSTHINHENEEMDY